MPSYLYGLILARNAHLIPAHITGIGGSAVRVIPCGDLAALAGTVDGISSRPTLEQVRAHDHALQSAVHHGATALAVRFGQTFASDADLRADVRAHGSASQTLLERYDGCVEMRILVALDARDAAPPAPAADASHETSPGTAYLRHLARDARASRDLASRLALKAAIGPSVIAERVDALPGARGAVFSHLVKRDDEGGYREAVALQPALGAAQVIGPLALYAFADSADE